MSCAASVDCLRPPRAFPRTAPGHLEFSLRLAAKLQSLNRGLERFESLELEAEGCDFVDDAKREEEEEEEEDTDDDVDSLCALPMVRQKGPLTLGKLSTAPTSGEVSMQRSASDSDAWHSSVKGSLGKGGPDPIAAAWKAKDSMNRKHSWSAGQTASSFMLPRQWTPLVLGALPRRRHSCHEVGHSGLMREASPLTLGHLAVF